MNQPAAEDAQRLENGGGLLGELGQTYENIYEKDNTQKRINR